MDTNNTSNVSDDQELAKVLEGMNQQAGATPVIPPTDPVAEEVIPVNDGLAFEEAAVNPTETPEAPVEPSPEPVVIDSPVVAPVDTPPTASPELDAIKKTALEELRPLVDRLDLPADEKFDTLLLIIRSTDDKSLVSAAHEAARGITDETKRAQALLDVIKEIDYFSGSGQQPA